MTLNNEWIKIAQRFSADKIIEICLEEIYDVTGYKDADDKIKAAIFELATIFLDRNVQQRIEDHRYLTEQSKEELQDDIERIPRAGN